MLDPVHIHLMVTHFPIVGSFLALIVLLAGLIGKHAFTRYVAYFLLVFCGLTAFAANSSGEKAEEILENRPEFSHDLIHEHEEAAEPIFLSMASLGALAIVTFAMERRKNMFAKPLSFVVLAGTVVCFGLSVRAGNLGGQIRHSEIRDSVPTSTQHPQEHE
jgi:uncharacterized membrane protein